MLLAPLGIEAFALRRGAPGATVKRTGMRARTVPPGDEPLVVAGFGGALVDAVAPGTLVVADEVASPDGDALPCDAAVAADLERAGLRVAVGRVATATRIVRRGERLRLAETGAIAADMESYWLRRAAGARPFAVVRAIVDTPGAELTNPLATLKGGVTAFRALSRAARWLTAGRPDITEEPCPSP